MNTPNSISSRPISFHWPSFLMAMVCSLGGLLLLVFAALCAVIGLGQLITQDTMGSTRLFMQATGLAFGAILLVPGATISLRRLFGKPKLPVVGRPLALWPFSLLILPWLGIIIIGQWVIDNSSLAWLLTPPLYLLAMSLPVLVLVALGLNGLPLGSGQRTWGIFSLGLVLGPILILIVEIVLVIAVLGVVFIFITLNPEIANSLINLLDSLEQASTEQQFIDLIIPYLLNPTIILSILVFVSLLIPLIEEPLKTIGVWLMWGRAISPSEGFALGILSGAGYALFESLGVGSNLSSDWGTLVFARFGTDLVHILNGGLLGWALVKTWKERRVLQLVLTFTLTIVIHGLWNGLSIAFGMNQIINLLPIHPENLLKLESIANIGLVGFTVTMLMILILINWALRRRAPANLSIFEWLAQKTKQGE